MQKALLSAFLFSSILITANAMVSISVNTKQELILTSTKCDTLIKERMSLCEWRKEVEPNFIIPAYINNKCLPSTKGLVKLIISECLPTFTKDYQNKKLVHYGPNC